MGEAGSRPREGDGQAAPLGRRRGAVALSRQKVNREEKKSSDNESPVYFDVAARLLRLCIRLYLGGTPGLSWVCLS